MKEPSIRASKTCYTTTEDFPDHARKVVDWYLDHQMKDVKDPWTLVKDHHHNPAKRKPKIKIQESINPAEYDTVFSDKKGIGVRQGWAGRS